MNTSFFSFLRTGHKPIVTFDMIVPFIRILTWQERDKQML